MMATGTIPNPPTREEFNALSSNISAMVTQYQYPNTYKSGDTLAIPADFVGGHLLYIALYRYGVGDYLVYSPSSPINMQTGLKSVGARNISFSFNASSNPTAFTITTSNTDELFCTLIRIA